MLITNETEKNTVKNIANNILPDCDEVFFEVGYFYFSGFEQIYEKLRNVKIKILIGINYDDRISSAITSNKNPMTQINPPIPRNKSALISGLFRIRVKAFAIVKKAHKPEILKNIRNLKKDILAFKNRLSSPT